MKLRLEKGNLKIRITPDKIGKLYVEKSPEEIVYISKNNYFIYSMTIEVGIEACMPNFQKNAQPVNVPLKKIERRINSNQVGIKETIVTDKEETIVLTLEEDLLPRKFKKSKYTKCN